LTSKRRRLWIVFGVTAVVTAIGAVICLLLYRGVMDIPCLFREVTGRLCPGCGNTGAALSLLRGDVVKAFHRNPLCFLEFGYIAWVLARMTVSYVRHGRFTYRSPCCAVDITVLAVILLWGVLRNML